MELEYRVVTTIKFQWSRTTAQNVRKVRDGFFMFTVRYHHGELRSTVDYSLRKFSSPLPCLTWCNFCWEAGSWNWHCMKGIHRICFFTFFKWVLSAVPLLVTLNYLTNVAVRGSLFCILNTSLKRKRKARCLSILNMKKWKLLAEW